MELTANHCSSRGEPTMDTGPHTSSPSHSERLRWLTCLQPSFWSRWTTRCQGRATTLADPAAGRSAGHLFLCRSTLLRGTPTHVAVQRPAKGTWLEKLRGANHSTHEKIGVEPVANLLTQTPPTNGHTSDTTTDPGTRSPALPTTRGGAAAAALPAGRTAVYWCCGPRRSRGTSARGTSAAGRRSRGARRAARLRGTPRRRCRPETPGTGPQRWGVKLGMLSCSTP